MGRPGPSIGILALIDDTKTNDFEGSTFKSSCTAIRMRVVYAEKPLMTGRCCYAYSILYFQEM
jgi:hypothetical protein